MRRAEHDRERPAANQALSNVNSNGDSTIVPGAVLAWRIAALRIEADRTRSRWLAAQLLDFADLLEVAEERRWFE